MPNVEGLIHRIERTTRGLHLLAHDLRHTTQLVDEQRHLLVSFRRSGVHGAAQAAEVEALERGYEGMDTGAYTLTAVRLLEASQGICNYFCR